MAAGSSSAGGRNGAGTGRLGSQRSDQRLRGAASSAGASRASRGGRGMSGGSSYAGSSAQTTLGTDEDVQSDADSFSERRSRRDERNGGQGYGKGRRVPPGLGGRGESEGEYDEDWSTGLDVEEQEIRLLGQDSTTRSPPSSAAKKRRLSVSRLLHLSSPPSSKPRTIPFNDAPSKRKKSSFAPNLVKNQKYNVATFLPLVLYEQFKFFYNLYFLLVAPSQFVPALRIGFLATYIVPLAFVLAVTIGKEAFDDYKRYLRDRAANSALYSRLVPHSASTPHSHHASSSTPSTAPLKPTPSSNLRVGDLVFLEKNDRVPADILLLRTSDPSGTCFVRTDQLDGETDWKLRVAVERTQALQSDADLLEIEGDVYADPPTKDIHTFVGTLTLRSIPASRREAGANGAGDAHEEQEEEDLVATHPVEPLTAENMLGANTVFAAGNAFGCDVGKFSSSSLGIMSTKLWDLDEGFGTSLKMSKAQRLETGDSAMTHAMLITAVHIDEKSGKPTRWRIENSWGPDVGEKGYFVMDDEWFSEYVYQVCADRKYVDSKLVDLFDKGEPTVLPPWDPMGTLA